MSGYTERLKWFDEAVLAVEAARSQPKFPGEQSPVYAILDKLVNKLYSECHDGEDIGTGGCPVCRAWRTERAEQAEKAADVKSARLTTHVAGLEAELAQERVFAINASTAFADASNDVAKLAKTNAALQVALDAVTEAEAYERAERGSAQSHVAGLEADVDKYRDLYESYRDQLKALKVALKELS